MRIKISLDAYKNINSLKPLRNHACKLLSLKLLSIALSLSVFCAFVWLLFSKTGAFLLKNSEGLSLLTSLN